MAVFLFGLAALAFALGIFDLIKLFLDVKEDMVHIVECGLLFQLFKVALSHDRIRGHHAQEDLTNITVDVFVCIIRIVRVVCVSLVILEVEIVPFHLDKKNYVKTKKVS